MPGFIHTRKREIPNLSSLTPDIITRIYVEICIPGFAELCRVGKGYREGNFFAAEPVADVISIAVYEGDFHAVGGEEGGERGERGRGTDEVAEGGEGLGDGTGGFGPVEGDAEGGEGVWVIEVAGVERWGEGGGHKGFEVVVVVGAREEVLNGLGREVGG